MPQTLTFAKVFTAEGEKNGKTWTRWDFKTEDGERYVTFNAGLANKISTNTPVTVEIEGENKIAALIASVPAENQQASSGSGGGPASPQGGAQSVTAPSERDTQIHRQTAAKVAAKLLDFFPEEEQSLETFFTVSDQLVSYFATGESIPF